MFQQNMATSCSLFWWNSAMSIMLRNVAASAFEKIVWSFPDPCACQGWGCHSLTLWDHQTSPLHLICSHQLLSLALIRWSFSSSLSSSLSLSLSHAPSPSLCFAFTHTYSHKESLLFSQSLIPFFPLVLFLHSFSLSLSLSLSSCFPQSLLHTSEGVAMFLLHTSEGVVMFLCCSSLFAILWF